MHVARTDLDHPNLSLGNSSPQLVAGLQQLRIHLRQQTAAVQYAGGRRTRRLILNLACLLRAHQRVLLIRQRLCPPQHKHVVWHYVRKAFVFLHQHPFRADDLKGVRVGGHTGGPQSALEARVTDLRIRADSMPDLPAAPAQAELEAPVLVVEPLTEREREVLVHLSGLLSTAEVASAMYISVNTVKTHLRSIYRKLAATHRNEAVRRARQLGLI